MGKTRKVIGYTLGIVIVLTAAIFLLNLHLTKRLERYLRKELIHRTAEATDGFYALSFDNLSISFFKGELKLEGIKLHPDPVVFSDWKRKDSLPSTYVTAEVGMIDFKGLNLTWRWNYKLLHFESFEIRNPEIRVFNPYYSTRAEMRKEAETKTLYEVISPYIDVLTVRVLNLENASVSYSVENPVSPIVYALDDVSFHAYGFRLDEDSSESGKLLYCDNFDFITNRSQTLLTNNDFRLQTDRILLSTEDSIISISNITLAPQGELWVERKQRPDSYLNALIRAVEVKGIRFRRENALNYLTARSFDIISSDIQAFNLAGESRPVAKGKKKTLNEREADSLVSSLSLYELISPVLHAVSIGTIGIEKAKLQYSFAVKDTVEVYRLANFDFHAYDFQVDSVSEARHGFWYSRGFSFEATGIEGLMTARNHRFTVERMALDTESGDFNLERIRLRPLSVRGRNDYMAGSIDTVGIRGLSYDKGISARLLKIDRPNLRYVVAPSFHKQEVKSARPENSRVDVEAILNPFLRYLAVKRVSLNHARVTVDDKSVPDPVTYKLNDFNFFATDILVDRQTGKGNGLFFDYGNMGFSFSRFDNYLPGKEYRLSVRKGQFSTVKGILELKDIQLLPQDTVEKTSIRFSSPGLRISGLQRIPERPDRNIRLASFRVDSPDIRVYGPDGSGVSASLKSLALEEIAWDSTLLKLGSVCLESPVADIYTGHLRDTLPRQTKAGSADLYTALGKVAGRISLGRFSLTDADVRYAYHGKSDSLQYQKLDTTNLFVEGLAVDTRLRTYKLDDIRFSTRNLTFPLDNGFYMLKVGGVDLNRSSAVIDRIRLVSPYPKMRFAYLQPHHKDWFDVSVGQISLTGIDLPSYFSEKVLRIADVQVSDVVLQNLKNQKIPVPRHIVPMIYAGLQKAPVKLDFQRVGVKNFSVVYEELSKKGTVPGKLFFTDMNGTFTGFTNIVSRPDQYIVLDADGKLMGKGAFTATWKLPVDSLNDRFLLNARLDSFDLTALNGLLVPLSSAEVRSGRVRGMTFSTEASSKGATVEMLFLYNDLEAALLKEKDGVLTDKKFLTGLVNRILKHDNPDKTREGFNKPRYSSVSIIRDPYHSTFNYLWQILRPPLIESVGVSKKKQDVAKGVMTFFTKVKNFFRGKKNVSGKPLLEEERKDALLLEFEPVNN
ncbi:hypothetical protein [uncultured Parabacteroides sp.]|uniref:hypothetical protein n=1 Tax=uncultured Parabacteroides sp. TaxID=512312 RepID=UPI00262DDE52|nr:hypothetical protein [uncultured Parabacteroides sp.]